jgi:hypothetical protein
LIPHYFRSNLPYLFLCVVAGNSHTWEHFAYLSDRAVTSCQGKTLCVEILSYGVQTSQNIICHWTRNSCSHRILAKSWKTCVFSRFLPVKWGLTAVKQTNLRFLSVVRSKESLSWLCSSDCRVCRCSLRKLSTLYSIVCLGNNKTEVLSCSYTISDQSSVVLPSCCFPDRRSSKESIVSGENNDIHDSRYCIVMRETPLIERQTEIVDLSVWQQLDLILPVKTDWKRKFFSFSLESCVSKNCESNGRWCSDLSELHRRVSRRIGFCTLARGHSPITEVCEVLSCMRVTCYHT